MPLLPVKLHSSFKGTDAKGLTSFYGLAALNFYFNGSQDVTKIALDEYDKNLTYQALSNENDNIFLSFTYGVSLIHSILEGFKAKQLQEIEKSKEISKKIKDKLDITFDPIESPAMNIQLGEEESDAGSELFVPKKYSTPLNQKQVAEMHDRHMDDYLRTALKLNQTNLESTIKFAESENTALIDEIINPTPGLIVHDEINLSQSFNSDLDPSFAFSNKLDTKLDDLLEDAKEKINSVSFPPELDDGIPNDPLYTEDFYIDESFTNILYSGGKQFYFKQPSNDDRTDFEITTPGSNMIIFKSPSLTFTTIEKDNLKTIINNIIEDLGLNFKNEAGKKESNQKITLLKHLNKRVDTAKNKDIEEQLQSHEWLNKLTEYQLKDNTSYDFGENYENIKFTNKFPYITKRKRKL